MAAPNGAGLAASGEPTFAQVFRREIVRLLPLGRFELNTRLLDFHLARAGLFVKEFIHLFGAPRQPSDELTQRHRDLAASAQLVLEEVLLHLGRHLRTLTGAESLCLAGGVAYNCVANGRLRAELGFKRVYVPPAAGDSGAALGAAVWWSARRGGTNNRPQMPSAYWGPQFEEDACRAALERERLAAEPLSDEQLYERVATELARGRLVFWFQGRMEWGPRALGNRSLLADPRREDMRELINSKVKCREPFRPFAPSVLDERAQEFFDLPAASPFMQFTVRVKASAKGIIPAVTHVDGTARVQTVAREANPRFYDLLATFGRLTGVPVLAETIALATIFVVSPSCSQPAARHTESAPARSRAESDAPTARGTGFGMASSRGARLSSPRMGPAGHRSLFPYDAGLALGRACLVDRCGDSTALSWVGAFRCVGADCVVWGRDGSGLVASDRTS